MARLADIPPRFTYKVLCGPTGCGKTRLLDAFRDAGVSLTGVNEPPMTGIYEPVGRGETGTFR